MMYINTLQFTYRLTCFKCFQLSIYNSQSASTRNFQLAKKQLATRNLQLATCNSQLVDYPDSVLKPIPIIYLTFEKYDLFTYTQHKSSTQVGVRVNSVLTMNDCIKCYLSLFKNIILQHLVYLKLKSKVSLRNCPI